MEKKTIFKGVGTALITPFAGGEIDFPALEKIIERQICEGINALIIGGTTGECATLSRYEKEQLYAFCAEKIGGRVPFIAGAGGCDTAAASVLAKSAAASGADAILSVTPYYNKGTEEGIIRHFEAIANASGLPLILYNVPSRTGVNLSIQSVKRLS